MAPGRASGSIISGTNTTSTTAEVLTTTSTPCRAVHLKNRDASITINIGDEDSQTFPLLATESIYLETNNVNNIWVDAASGTPIIDWIAEQ